MTERGRRGSSRSINKRSATGGLSHGFGRSQSVRCAIYTRKSTEEGLEQAFNSLDAQREACGAYVRSQQHEGWTELPTRYDDGGFSGGSMERPALAALLDDIRAGRIDTVVVYKVDRLTRSLADFAKIVELFEGQGVSFVSVTQQFNTTTSMGRLTLNVLLSFAQFEREVTAERIRDKIAASKKKGMWMGGAVPIGYRVEDRKLVIDQDAAETVRRIFELYRELGSVREVKTVCDQQGIVTTTRTSRTGRTTGGRSFSRGHLYWLLRNPIYTGRVKHHGQTFDGQHEPIIDGAMWVAVQDMLDGQVKHRKVRTKVPSSSHLLKGRLFDEVGQPLYATQASKQGQRYSYYTSKHLVVRKADSTSGWRLPAPELDQLIIDQLIVLLRDPLRLMDLLAHDQDASNAVTRTIDAASRAADFLASADGNERRCMLDTLLERVELREIGIVLRLRPSAIDGESGPGGPGTGPLGDGDWTVTVVVELSIQLSRRANGSRIVLGGGDQATNEPDPKLVQLVADAHRWNRMLAEGSVASLRELSELEQLDRSDVGRILNLAYLAPDIVEAILDGRQPPALTVYGLGRMSSLPLDWSEQRRVLGFNV